LRIFLYLSAFGMQKCVSVWIIVYTVYICPRSGVQRCVSLLCFPLFWAHAMRRGVYRCELSSILFICVLIRGAEVRFIVNYHLFWAHLRCRSDCALYIWDTLGCRRVFHYQVSSKFVLNLDAKLCVSVGEWVSIILAKCRGGMSINNHIYLLRFVIIWRQKSCMFVIFNCVLYLGSFKVHWCICVCWYQ